MPAARHTWTLIQTWRHTYRWSIRFVCMCSTVPQALLRSAVRVRLGGIGRGSQRSRGSQICGVWRGLESSKTSAAPTIVKDPNEIPKPNPPTAFIFQRATNGGKHRKQGGFQKALTFLGGWFYSRDLKVTRYDGHVYWQLYRHCNFISARWKTVIKTGSLESGDSVLCHCAWLLMLSV